MKNTFSKGFTLVELLIVITILAALAAAVVVVLNPMELMAQGRDAQRMADLSTVQDALRILIAQGLVPAPNLCLDAAAIGGGCNDGGICMFEPGLGNGPFSVQNCGGVNEGRAVDGTGWVDVNLAEVRVGGSLIVALPIDPIHSASFFYAYKATPGALGTFKLAGRLESVRYRGAMAFDGGTRNCLCNTAVCTPANIASMTVAESTANNCFYEIGSNLAL